MPVRILLPLTPRLSCVFRSNNLPHFVSFHSLQTDLLSYRPVLRGIVKSITIVYPQSIPLYLFLFIYDPQFRSIHPLIRQYERSLRDSDALLPWAFISRFTYGAAILSESRRLPQQTHTSPGLEALPPYLIDCQAGVDMPRAEIPHGGNGNFVNVLKF